MKVKNVVLILAILSIALPAATAAPAKKKTKPATAGRRTVYAGNDQRVQTSDELEALKPKPTRGLKFPAYDAGGFYYYSKGQYEKARQYWMTSLQYAEQEVPQEKARGLSPETEKATCSLIRHLMYFINDSHYKPGYYAVQMASGFEAPVGMQASQARDPRQRQLDNLKGQMRGFEDDLRWWDRVQNFSDRALGKGHTCLLSYKGYMETHFNYKILNTKAAITQLERELNQAASLEGQRTKWTGAGSGQNGGTNGNGVENPWP
jgi:hypothetical protein